MFTEHQKRWLAYPQFILDNLRFIIVDDGSSIKPAVNYLVKDISKLHIEIYRIDIDRRWNQDGAKNLGALFCVNEWIFLSDMDHFLPEFTATRIFDLCPSIWTYFTFSRLTATGINDDISSFKPYKPHPNSYLIHWQLYWRVGGYNEDYCGYYGTDWIFRQSLKAFGYEERINSPIIRFPRALIEDASTSGIERKSVQDRESILKLYKHNRKRRCYQFPRALRFPWHKEYPTGQCNSTEP